MLNSSLTGLDIQDLSIGNADINDLVAAKVFGDAGVEFIDIGPFNNVPTSVQNLGSFTLDAPTGGFAVVSVSGFAVTFGDDTQIVLGLGTNATTFNVGFTRAGTLDGTETGREERSLSLLRVVRVSSGPNTFFVNAQKSPTFDTHSVNLVNVFAAALFVPKRY